MNPTPRVHDRTDKVRSRRRRMPVQGRALKRLLTERANAAAKQRIAHAKGDHGSHR